VRYPSFDDVIISAFLYIPHNLARDASHPAIVSVHGGPSAQTMNGFNRSIQYLVNNGYIVIAPNYRGSTGYGKDFEEKNRFDMGGGDLQDVAHAARFLETTGYVNPHKIAITGASYGGYMTMLGLTKKPEIWAAGVAIVPFVNWFTELEHEDPVLREWDLATMGDPVKNRALYEDRSPINFIDCIRAPLLVLAGGNDPRCPKEESDQVVEAIRRRGGVVEYHFYENEGHGFSRIENGIDSFKRTVAFLDKYVK
jgi:dipeptidyl aminopeptidase/acylaminoacyl peptidase